MAVVSPSTRWALRSFAKVLRSFSQIGLWRPAAGSTTYPLAQTVAPNGNPYPMCGPRSDPVTMPYCALPTIPYPQICS
jgi:hypothetical protein